MSKHRTAEGPPQEVAIRVQSVAKSYRMGRTTLDVLHHVSLDVRRGEIVSIMGASGSGKSTLLHLMGLLDRPDDGRIWLGGRDTSAFSARKRNATRRREIGFVFQFYHLLPELNVLENALLPAMVDASVIGWPGRRSEMRRRAVESLDRLGLSGRLKHKPKELSGGERQRVAIARALMNRPSVILADEPTGNLDSATGKQILAVLLACAREYRQTLVLVTHDPQVASQANRVLTLRDGRFEK
jgi:ABC-type lipoprotein export system ATPase subunit